MPHWTTPDGAQLAYELGGSGSPVVLVHGFGLDAALWDPQWPDFTARHRVLRYDLRGHGASSPPAGRYAHGADLAALAAALGATPAHVVGLSLGGAVALELALAEPARVRSLTLVDAVLGGQPMSAEWGERWRAVVAAGRAGDLEQAKRLWLAHPLFAVAAPATRAALAAMVARYSGWHWRERDPLLAPAVPAAERLAEVRAPTLVVVGEGDLADFRAIAARLAAGIPGATLAVLGGAGHAPNLDVPAEFNALVLAHLARH
ncbi:MAG: alpha/beta fold hydrolase [Proteobacteria bacterium]|nr:alpha/beta fold hydrolase [Pseudomonadota bacterium]